MTKADLFLRPLFDWRSAVASQHGPESPTTRLVLLTLSLHMSPKGDSCYPSGDTLARETGLSRRAVVVNLQAAAKAGWIGKAERKSDSGQGWRRVEYFAQIPAAVETALRQAQEQGGDPGSPRRRGDPDDKGGDPDDTKVGNQDHTSSSMSTSGNKPSRAALQPGPVAECFKRYSRGMKAKTGVEYPGSARANGQLAQLVKRVGAEHAPAVVDHFLASPDPYYAKTGWRLDSLVRDCERLYMAMKSRGAEADGPEPETAEVEALCADDRRMVLQEYPIDEPMRVARRAGQEYAKLLTQKRAHSIAVKIGKQRNVYRIEELWA